MQDLKDKLDEELVEMAQKGDALASDTLLRRYNSAVLARARQFFLVGGETEDLVQEGMIGMFYAVRDYRRESGKSFKNFAYMCVTRRIIDGIKKMTTKNNAVLTESIPLLDQQVLDLLDESVSPEEYVINNEARTELHIKLSQELSDLEYRVLKLYMEGMNYTQICKATKKSFKSVDNALMRARKKLQKAFKK